MHVLDERVIRRALKGPAEGVQMHLLPRVGSTMEEARRLAAEGAPHGTVVLAEEQTAGRGRRGRSFFSPGGTGVYMSILLRPELSPEQSLGITTAAAVASARASEAVSGRMAGIKWVNDIYMEERKVCGILTEGAAEEGRLRYAVVGIGCNACPPEGGFPPEVADIAGAVLPRFEPLARERLTAAVLNEFFALYPGIAAGAHAEEYRRRCMVPGRRVTVLRGGIATPALALEVDGECRLVVRYEDGRTEALSSGEISIRL